MAAVKFAVAVVLAALIVVSIGRGLALGTRAESGDFTTGTVSISAVPSGALFTSHEAAPGAALTGSMTVTNVGSLELRYAVTKDATGDTSAGQMTVTVWAAADEQDFSGTCESTPPAAVLYGPSELDAGRKVNLIGDPAQGLQPGDRTLRTGASETLCLKFSLPASAEVLPGGLLTTPAFSFDAEQTAHNP